MARDARVSVVGCGVIGLTTAIALQERGFAVRIVARDLPPRTTSDVPAALFHPYKVGPPERVRAWARATRERLLDLAADPATGVVRLAGLEVSALPIEGEPWWREAAVSFRRARPEELPGWAAGGFAYQSLVVETPLHLPWLLDRFRKQGGEIERAAVGDLAAFARSGPVVHCGGLGARELARDPLVYASRGQLVHLEPFDLGRFLVCEWPDGALSYIVPRRDAVVVGGTAEDGVESLAVDPEATRGLLERAARLLPELAGRRVLREVVGLRPCRPAVRLEVEDLPGGGFVVHNYGHGGSGFTLAWGCAAEAAALVARRLG
jgi:D-amino-acid oxidase